MRIPLLASIVVLVALTGCAAEPEAPAPTAAGSVTELEQGETQVITFDSGVKCHILDGHKSGGISCDFSSLEAGFDATSLPEDVDLNPERGFGLGVITLLELDGDVCAVYDTHQGGGIDCMFA